MSMTKTVTISAVNKVITVNAPQQRAVDVFTSQIDKWWTRTHHIGAAPMVSSTIEPRVGGRWYVKHEDGCTTVPASQGVDPPHRLVHSWASAQCGSPIYGRVGLVRFTLRAQPHPRRRSTAFERRGEDGGRA